jgi:NADH-quinone oxidoreductase subunit G
MLARPRKALIAWQVGSLDCAHPAAFDRARRAATFFAYVGAYACKGVRDCAQVVLPIGLPPEIDGSFVNVDGRVQSFRSGAALPGDSRAGWRVLRALGAALGLPGFAFEDLAGLRAGMPDLASAKAPQARAPARRRSDPQGIERIATVPIYRSDAVVRRAAALQASGLNHAPHVIVHPGVAKALGLAPGSSARVSDGGNEVVLPLAIDPAVPHGAAWIAAGYHETAALGPTGTALTIGRA